MSALLNKIERRLGMRPLVPHLPEPYNKESWAEVITEDTLDTFSRYYPKKIPFKITKETAPRKDGWYYINEDYIGNQKILGAGDLDWSVFGKDSVGLAQQFGGYGYPDVGMSNFNMQDIQSLAMRANYASMFSNSNVYPEFRYPNQLRIVSIANSNVRLGDFTINLYVKHSDDLSSISPTKMETFEALAIADVAMYLSRNLKYWDGLETVLSTLDLKLNHLEDEASRRESIVDKLENSFVSAGNESIPFIMTV